jgi:hypothetical protein
MSRHKLITCILTKQVAIEMITRLKEEKGIITANTTHARGRNFYCVSRCQKGG